MLRTSLKTSNQIYYFHVVTLSFIKDNYQLTKNSNIPCLIINQFGIFPETGSPLVKIQGLHG